MTTGEEILAVVITFLLCLACVFVFVIIVQKKEFVCNGTWVPISATENRCVPNPECRWVPIGPSQNACATPEVK